MLEPRSATRECSADWASAAGRSEEGGVVRAGGAVGAGVTASACSARNAACGTRGGSCR